MAKKTVEAEVKMTDSTAAGAAGIAASAEKVGKAFTAMDKATMKAAADSMKERRAAERTLMEQKIANLRREEDLGSRRAALDAKQLEMTMRLKRERQDLLRIAHAEHTTLLQKTQAFRQLAALERNAARQIAFSAFPPGVAARMAGRSPAAGAAGFGAMVGAAMPAVGAAMAGNQINAALEGMRQLAAGAVEFAETMKDLSSLGDNLKNMPAIRAGALAMSTTYGRPVGDVANLRFMVESSTAGMSADVQQRIQRTALKIGQVAAGDPADFADAIAGVVRTYGLSPEEAGDRIFQGAERGKLSMADMARHLPKVLSTAKAFDYSADELFAAIAAGTRMGGRPEESFTQLRNIMLRMPNRGAGGLVEQVEGLKGIDRETLKKTFGDDSVAMALSLRENTKDLSAEMKIQARGVVDSRLADRMKDAAFAAADLAKSLEQAGKNKLIGAGQRDIDVANRMESTRLGRADPLADDLMPSFLAPLDLLAGRVRNSDAKGALMLAKEAAAAGDLEKFQGHMDRALKWGGAGRRLGSDFTPEDVELLHVIQNRLMHQEQNRRMGAAAMAEAQGRTRTDVAAGALKALGPLIGNRPLTKFEDAEITKLQGLFAAATVQPKFTDDGRMRGPHYVGGTEETQEAFAKAEGARKSFMAMAARATGRGVGALEDQANYEASVNRLGAWLTEFVKPDGKNNAWLRANLGGLLDSAGGAVGAAFKAVPKFDRARGRGDKADRADIERDYTGTQLSRWFQGFGIRGQASEKDKLAEQTAENTRQMKDAVIELSQHLRAIGAF